MKFNRRYQGFLEVFGFGGNRVHLLKIIICIKRATLLGNILGGVANFGGYSPAKFKWIRVCTDTHLLVLMCYEYSVHICMHLT